MITILVDNDEYSLFGLISKLQFIHSLKTRSPIDIGFSLNYNYSTFEVVSVRENYKIGFDILFKIKYKQSGFQYHFKYNYMHSRYMFAPDEICLINNLGNTDITYISIFWENDLNEKVYFKPFLVLINHKSFYSNNMQTFIENAVNLGLALRYNNKFGLTLESSKVLNIFNNFPYTSKRTSYTAIFDITLGRIKPQIGFNLLQNYYSLNTLSGLTSSPSNIFVFNLSLNYIL